MPVYRIAEAAQLLGVSDDTLRRWIESGRVATTPTDHGRLGIEGAHLAALARELTSAPEVSAASARNRFPGIVTDVRRDSVMAQVELCCGPHRVVSLMTREAADEVGLERGVRPTASVKATTVVVELA